MPAPRVVHVLVGLIADASGRWLVNQRRPVKPMSGYWEFPGGKLAAGEERFAALRRELTEELGIDLLEAQPLLELVHDYADLSARLDVWRVLSYRGDVVAREGQPLRWVGVDELADLALLEADLPIVDELRALAASPSR